MVRLYLGSILAAMALGQLLSWKGYLSAVAGYGFRRSSSVVAVGLFAGEVVAAVGLLVHPSPGRVAIASLALAVTVVWTALALNAFLQRRHVPNCACFGMFFRQELRWWVLLEDVVFVGAAAWHLTTVL